MNIYLYSLNKRKNSTKVPTITGTLVTCVLKDATSINNPSFLLNSKPDNSINYIGWDDRYYWVDNLTYETNNLWRVDCSIDVLGTYATEIKNTSCFIEFCSGGDGRIIDPRLAKKINATELNSSALIPDTVIDRYGMIIMQVVGLGCSGSVGFVGGQLAISLVRSILDEASNWYDQLSNFDTSSVENAIKSIGRIAFSGSASENVKSLYWVPMIPTTTGGNLFLGLYDTQVSCYLLDNTEVYGTGITLSVPHAPNVYQRNSQYSDYNLYIPFIGNISLSADILADESSLRCEFSVAPVTGDFTVLVKTSSGKILGSYGSSVRVDIPMGTAGMSTKNLANSITSAGGIIRAGASLGESVGGGVGAVVGAISGTAGALMSIEGSSNSVGGLGSGAALQLDQHITLTCSYWDYSDTYSSVSPVIGNPFYKVDSIGNHTYVKTGAGSISGVAYGTQLDRINALCHGGIYVE